MKYATVNKPKRNNFFCFATFVGMCLTLLTTSGLWSVEQAKIEMIGGVPRVTLDGVPTALRLFRGGSNPSFFHFDKKPAELSEVFLCVEDVQGKGTLLLSFATRPDGIEKDPISFFMDDVAITEVETGRKILGPCHFNDAASLSPEWIMYSNKKTEPVGSLVYAPDQGKNGSGCLQFKMDNPADKLWPQHLLVEHRHDLDLKKGMHYRLEAWCHATSEIRVGINAYKPDSTYRLAGAMLDHRNDPLRLQTKWAKESGFDQIVLSAILPWPKAGEAYNFTNFDADIDLVLKTNPNAQFIFWFGCDPPEWWLDENKDHEEVLLGANEHMQYKKRTAAISSPLYVEDACRHIKATIEHLEKKYGPHIIGYQPCAQNTWEWFYQGVVGSNAFPGFAPIDRIEWNRWLKEKYKTTQALHKAWHTNQFTLGDIDVPSLELRRKGQEEVLLDVAKDPIYYYLNDYNEFMQKAMSHAIFRMAKTSKEACQFKRLVTFFYAYYFQFSSYLQGSAVTGHLDLESLLDSPYIDGYAAPYAYSDRDLGGYPAQMTPAESMLLHKKIFIVEDDLRTYRCKSRANQHPLTAIHDLAQTCEAHRRNTAGFAIRNYECWYVDLNKTGWLNDEGIWKNLKTIQPISQYFLNHPVAYQPDVAVFCGTKSLLTVPNHWFTYETISFARWMFSRVGIASGQYILSDYIAGRTNAKVNILSAAWNLNAQERKTLRKKAETDTIVWAFASGWLDEKEGGSVQYMSEAMPFKVKKIANPKKPLVLTEVGQKAGMKTEYESYDYPYIVSHYLNMKPGQKKSCFNFDRIPEVFTVEDAKPEEVLVRYADGSPAMVMRTMPGGGHSIFLGFPAMSQEIVHIAARAAGAPIYTDQGPVMFANEKMIVLHGSKPGTDSVRLQLPKTAEVLDCYDNKDMGKGTRFDLKLDWGKTRVLFLNPPPEIRQSFSGKQN